MVVSSAFLLSANFHEGVLRGLVMAPSTKKRSQNRWENGSFGVEWTLSLWLIGYFSH